MSEMFYLNGEMTRKEQAKISVLDYGFLSGYGLYETVRAYDGRPFRLDAHIARMRYSAEKLGILLRPGILREAVLDTVKANAFKDTRIRITVSIGEGSVTPDLASCEEPTVAVLVSDYQPPPPEKYANGYKAVISAIRRNSRSPVTSMKSLSGLENMLARQEARKAGADEALFLNERDYLSEASGCNVFVVKEGKLLTPRFETGILPGVTRVVVLEIAHETGIKVRERNLRLSELEQADEAFLTNSVVEIVPLTFLGGTKIGAGTPGPVTERVMAAYRQKVMAETGAG